MKTKWCGIKDIEIFCHVRSWTAFYEGSLAILIGIPSSDDKQQANEQGLNTIWSDTKHVEIKGIILRITATVATTTSSSVITGQNAT